MNNRSKFSVENMENDFSKRLEESDQSFSIYLKSIKEKEMEEGNPNRSYLFSDVNKKYLCASHNKDRFCVEISSDMYKLFKNTDVYNESSSLEIFKLKK